MKIAVLYRALDPRFSSNFAQDVFNREDDSYRASIVAALRAAGGPRFAPPLRPAHSRQ